MAETQEQKKEHVSTEMFRLGVLLKECGLEFNENEKDRILKATAAIMEADIKRKVSLKLLHRSLAAYCDGA